jgi:hypothetical protein
VRQNSLLHRTGFDDLGTAWVIGSANAGSEIRVFAPGCEWNSGGPKANDGSGINFQ